MNMDELPIPKWPEDGPFYPNHNAWSEDQMRSYAAAAVAAERERCAKICEEIEDQAWTLWQIAADPTEQGRNIGAQHCADAIRKN